MYFIEFFPFWWRVLATCWLLTPRLVSCAIFLLRNLAFFDVICVRIIYVFKFIIWSLSRDSTVFNCQYWCLGTSCVVAAQRFYALGQLCYLIFQQYARAHRLSAFYCFELHCKIYLVFQADNNVIKKHLYNTFKFYNLQFMKSNYFSLYIGIRFKKKTLNEKN